MPRVAHHIRNEDWSRYEEIAAKGQVPDMLTWAVQNYEITDKPKPKKKRKIILVPKYEDKSKRVRKPKPASQQYFP